MTTLLNILKFVLLKFWYITIPLIIVFFLWVYKKKQLGKRWVQLTSLAIIALVALTLVGIYMENNQNASTYISNKVEDGRLVPSRIEPSTSAP